MIARGLGWLPALVAGLVAAGVTVRAGVSALDVVVYAVYVVVGVALPGVFCWRLLLRRLHTGTDADADADADTDADTGTGTGTGTGDDRRCPTWFEDLSLGTIFGFAVQLPFFLVGVAVGFPLLVVVVPVLVVGLSWTGLGRGVWALPSGSLDPGVSWGLAGVACFGLGWLGHNVFPLRPLSLPPNRTPSIDETFHQALVADIAHRFPPQIPFLLDTRLDYHWFAHAQIATSRQVTGIDTVVTLRVLLPVLMLVLIVAGLGAVALRLAGRPVAAFLAPALLVGGAFHLLGPDYPAGTFTEPVMSQRYVSSPSQTYGVLMSMPALMLIFEVLRPGSRFARGTWVALAVALLALSGAKATFLPIFLCGAIAVWVTLLVLRRRVDAAATGVVVLVAVATVFASVVIFGGRTGAMSFAPLGTVETAVQNQGIDDTPWTRAAMLGALLTSWLLYGVGVVGLAARRHWLDPRAVFMLVAIPAGITVALLFIRSGGSQLWFQRSTAELVVLLSAWGMACLLPRPLTTRQALGLSGLAALAGLTAFALSSYTDTFRPEKQASTPDLVLTVVVPLALFGVYVAARRVAARVPGALWRPGPVVLLAVLLGLGTSHVFQLVQEELTGEPPDRPSGLELFARGGVAAAERVRDSSEPDAVVATNMHCARPGRGRCDNRHFWVSAYSERRVVIEGWGYSAPTNEAATGESRNAFIPTPFPQRLDINDAAFRDPSQETVGRLVDTYGVDWLVASKDYPADVAGLSALDGVLSKVYSNQHYAVFQVR